MNILMLTNTYLPHVGGVARSVETFTRGYRERGHRTIVVAPEFEGMPEREDDVIRIPALQNFNGSDFSVRLPVPGLLTLALESCPPDVIHSHHPFLLGDTALRLAGSYGVPIVFTHHTMYEQYTHYVPGNSEALRRFVIELATGYANLCDRVIAPSQSVAQILLERGVTSPLEVIPTGVDTERFSRGDGARFRSEHGIAGGDFVVGHVGRLAPEKNLQFLAEAVAAFLKDSAAARFLVVGGGPSEGLIREIFDLEGFGDRLRMTGPLEGQALVDAYHAMDVFAFASTSETQGMVLAEAMAAEVPVVALDACGVREVVRDGMNGRLLRNPTQTEFASALAWIAGSEENRRQSLRHEAFLTAREVSAERSIQRALDLYEFVRAEGAKDQNSEEDSPWASALRWIKTEWDLWANFADAADAALSNPETETPGSGGPHD